MLKKFFQKPLVKILLAGIVIVSIIVTVLVKTKAEPFVHQKITEWLETSPFAPGSIEFDGPDIDLLNRSIAITNIRIKQDTLNRLYGSVKEIKVSGISISSFLWGDTLQLGKISFVQPDIHIGEKIPQNHSSSGGDSSKKSKPTTIKILRITNGKLVVDQEPMLIRTSLDLTLEDGRYRGTTSSDTLAPFAFEKLEFFSPDLYWKSNNMHVEGPLAIHGSGATIDPADTLGSLPLTLKKLEIHSDSLTSVTADSSYVIVFKNMRFKKEDHDLQIAEVKINSPTKRVELGRKLGHEIDWMNLRKLQVHITGLDYRHYMETQELLIHQIQLDSAQMTVFRDKRLPYPDKPPTVLPYVFLQRIPTPFRVDSMIVSNANITYEEFVANGNDAGHVRFEDINADIGAFSNMDSLSREAQVKMKTQCMVMGKGRLTADFIFPLNDQSGLHYVSGKLGSMDMSEVNPMISKVGFMRIKEGRLLNMNFNFAYNSSHSDGDLTMFYDDLKIETIDKESNSSEGTGEAIKSFVANALLMKNKNLPDEKYRRGMISFERDNKKSILNYWWKSVLSGIKSTMMATKESELVKTE